MVSKNPVKICVPVCVTRSSCRISFQFRSIRSLRDSLRPSVGSTSSLTSTRRSSVISVHHSCRFHSSTVLKPRQGPSQTELGSATSAVKAGDPLDQILQRVLELVFKSILRELSGQRRQSRILRQLIGLTVLGVIVDDWFCFAGQRGSLEQQMTEQECCEGSIDRHALLCREA